MKKTLLAFAGAISLLLPFCLSGAEPQLEVYRDSSGKPVSYAGTVAGGKVMIPARYVPKRVEARGVWVATVENIDFPQQLNADSFKRYFLQIAKNLSDNNFNFIVFQVRPTNDAFYPSQFNPYSRYLVGKEGHGIDEFDPLKFMVEAAHQHGLQFHAWLNPYRVVNATPLSKEEYLKTLDLKNFARQHPELVLEIPLENNQRMLILNPGEPEVVNFILLTVREIIQKYDVDAIHLDDYFYPYRGVGNADNATYQKRHGKLTLDDWRRNNVNTLIRSLNKVIRDHNQLRGKKVQLGISPFGIWANKSEQMPQGSLTRGAEAYSKVYADTRRWGKSGWIDYIVPQLYWPFGRDVAAYAALADWWADTARGTRVNLYIGHGPYNFGSSSLWNNPNEIFDELRYNQRYPEIKGELFFSYKSLFKPSNAIMKKGAERVLTEFKKSRPIMPSCGPYRQIR